MDSIFVGVELMVHVYTNVITTSIINEESFSLMHLGFAFLHPNNLIIFLVNILCSNLTYV